MKNSNRLLSGLLGLLVLSGCSSETTKSKATRWTSEDTSTKTETTKETEPEETTTSEETTTTVPETSASESSEETTTETEETTEPIQVTIPDLTEKGLASKSAYESFLKDEIKVDISPLDDKATSINAAIIGTDVRNQEMTCTDLVSYFKEKASADEADQTDVAYGYLDCGLDGDPELVVRIRGLGPYEEQLLFKYENEKVVLKDAYESWDRSQTLLNVAGGLQSSGSGGATMHIFFMGYLDNTATLNKLCEVVEQYDSYASLDPKLEVMDMYVKQNGLTSNCVIMQIARPNHEYEYTYAILNEDADPSIYTSGKMHEVFTNTKLPYQAYPDFEKQLKEWEEQSFSTAPEIEWIERS